MSGTKLSRVRTELRLLPPEAYQQKSDRVERCPRNHVVFEPGIDLSGKRGDSFPLARLSRTIAKVLERACEV